MSACPLLWIGWEKLKEIKLKILACLHFLYVVLSPSLYMLIQLFLSRQWMFTGIENNVTRKLAIVPDE